MCTHLNYHALARKILLKGGKDPKILPGCRREAFGDSHTREGKMTKTKRQPASCFCLYSYQPCWASFSNQEQPRLLLASLRLNILKEEQILLLSYLLQRPAPKENQSSTDMDANDMDQAYYADASRSHVQYIRMYYIPYNSHGLAIQIIHWRLHSW